MKNVFAMKISMDYNVCQSVGGIQNFTRLAECVSVCVKPRVYVCTDRTAGKQMAPRGSGQPRFTFGRAKLSNYRS